MYKAEELSEKWKPVMEHDALPEIKDAYRRDVTLRLLENQEKFLNEAAPTNSMGASSSTAGSGAIDTWDPILMGLVRRSMPQMIAYDICGVQPMTGPTGLIFAMKANYTNQSGGEAFGATGTGADEAHTEHSGTGTHTTTDSTNNPFSANDSWKTGLGMGTSAAEALGDGAGPHFAEMAFTIEKTSVTAKSRALKAEYSTELAQDLKAVHGLDAEAELSNILSTEILAEINREIVRRVLTVAKLGALNNTTTDGTFDLDTDSNGRWSVEKFKGLHFQIERDANVIATETRRGRGNIIIASADVVAALSMTGSLDTGGAIAGGTVSDDGITGNTFVGTLNGKYKVYVDPYYAATDQEFICVGYKGSSPYDAGIFYCPYVPLQMVRATGEQTFQPKIGFKTRYGLVSNPFVEASAGTPDESTLTANVNQYYRKFKVANLM